MVVAWLALAPAALASSSQEMVLHDDPRITFAKTEEELDRNIELLRLLGVDRLRVSFFWDQIAPRPTSLRRPRFGPGGPASPSSYPDSAWLRYDRIVKAAARHGVAVNFTLTSPAPRWATGDRRGHWRPRPGHFEDFVTAVGRRYSGTWPDPASEGSAEPQDEPGGLLPEFPQAGAGAGVPQPQPGFLPRVSHWSLWNEPNFPTWLSPQWRHPTRKGGFPLSPIAYRRMADEGWRALEASGHAEDTILLGELAARGKKIMERVAPLLFIRELYCLDRRHRPYRGEAARRRRCPDTGAERRDFIDDHPGLFEPTGWGYHPYSAPRSPAWRDRDRDAAALGNISRLIRTVDAVNFRWGSDNEPEIWITEYGYQTDPDPFIAVSYFRQAAWNSWAESLAYRNRRIASFAQFLLYDDRPDMTPGLKRRRRWATWQSGLLSADGEPKHALEEFSRPIYVRSAGGGEVTVFGALRPAAPGTVVRARIELLDDQGVTALRELAIGNPRHYVNTRVAVPHPGRIRIVWIRPDGSVVNTRSVPVG